MYPAGATKASRQGARHAIGDDCSLDRLRRDKEEVKRSAAELLPALSAHMHSRTRMHDGAGYLAHTRRKWPRRLDATTVFARAHSDTGRTRSPLSQSSLETRAFCVVRLESGLS